MKKIILILIILIILVLLIYTFVRMGNNTKRRGERMATFLENNITKESSLRDIIDIFEQMCQMPINDDMLLFETGTYDFTGEDLFYFSLVRQFPNGQDEYYQVHVDVQYTPNLKNKNFEESVWNIDLKENIFDYVYKSEVYNCVANDEYVNVDIYFDET